MPVQARALKKYRRGTPPVSKVSDNEDSTASLGHSKELSVQHSPGATIPELRQRPEDGAKIPPSAGRQNASDVLPNDPPRPQSASKPRKLDGQVATRIIQAASSSGDAKALARRPSGQNIDWTGIGLNSGEVAKIRHVRVVVSQYRRTKWVDFRKPGRPEPERRPGDRHRLNSRANTAVDHRAAISGAGPRGDNPP
jgi:hypothetical protein